MPSHVADYRVGSCYHCLINVPPGSLTAWILVFIFTIGWATTTWLSLDYGKDLLKWVQTEDSLTYEEIALITIAIATALITVVFLIIATFSSQKMSRYSFASSKKNKFGYCLSVTVIVLSFVCVLFWTCIIALTMLPIAVLSIAHLLVQSDSVSCLHLQSYGVGISPNMTGITNTSLANDKLTCGDSLDMWMDDAWRAFVPLLISLAFALAIEGCMLGFLVAASSNARHLKERMEYMNEPYSYSTDNLNGNVKATSAHDKTQTNNNQSDTQI